MRAREPTAAEPGTVAVYSDITELKQREKELNTARGQLKESSKHREVNLANTLERLAGRIEAIAARLEAA